MTPTMKYFISLLDETASKALGCPVTVELKSGKVTITAHPIPGQSGPFWEALNDTIAKEDDEKCQ